MGKNKVARLKAKAAGGPWVCSTCLEKKGLVSEIKKFENTGAFESHVGDNHGNDQIKPYPIPVPGIVG